MLPIIGVLYEGALNDGARECARILSRPEPDVAARRGPCCRSCRHPARAAPEQRLLYSTTNYREAPPPTTPRSHASRGTATYFKETQDSERATSRAAAGPTETRSLADAGRATGSSAVCTDRDGERTDVRPGRSCPQITTARWPAPRSSPAGLRGAGQRAHRFSGPDPRAPHAPPPPQTPAPDGPGRRAP